MKNESLKRYASGSVESSKLLLVKIKETFDVPDDILPPLIYDDDNPEQELLHPTANDIYFTKKFATFDFESKLQKTTIEKVDWNIYENNMMMRMLLVLLSLLRRWKVTLLGKL